jgi:uncharacterized membrane protein
VSRKHARRAVAGTTAAPAVAGTAAPPSAREPALDALRGAAIVAMVAYHFSFDLRYFGLTQWDFYRDPFWLNTRTLILSSFLLIAGISLVLAQRARTSPAQFWRHVGTIAACALAVSGASYVLFPASWIWFGVLHAIAVSLVLARPLVRRPILALVIGAGMIAAGNLYSNAVFDNRALGWLGFMTAKPRTEDYVPLFPWTGVLLVGISAGHALLRAEMRHIAFAARWPRWMAWLGRHSLAVYMAHQPMLLGLLGLAVGR